MPSELTPHCFIPLASPVGLPEQPQPSAKVMSSGAPCPPPPPHQIPPPKVLSTVISAPFPSVKKPPVFPPPSQAPSRPQVAGIILLRQALPANFPLRLRVAAARGEEPTAAQDLYVLRTRLTLFLPVPRVLPVPLVLPVSLAQPVVLSLTVVVGVPVLLALPVLLVPPALLVRVFLERGGPRLPPADATPWRSSSSR